jgi:prepilin peptidase CpaA
MSAFPVLRLVIMAAFLLAAVVLDVRERNIPNRLTVGGALAGTALAALEIGGFPLNALLGALVALVVSLPLFAAGAVGAGDSKLFAMVGTFLGPGALLSVLLYGGLAGGALALAVAVKHGRILPLLLTTKDLMVWLVTFGRSGERRTLATAHGADTVPYGVAIAAGALVAWFVPLTLGASP